MRPRDKLFTDANGNYNGITMEKDHASLKWDEADSDRMKYLIEIDRWMGQYEEYIEHKGELSHGNDAQ